MEGKIQTFLDVNLLKGDRKQLWVNPDCGLKTREWSQVCQPCLDVPDALGVHRHACFATLCWLSMEGLRQLCSSFCSVHVSALCSAALQRDMAGAWAARCCRRWRTWSRRPPTRVPRSELLQQWGGANGCRRANRLFVIGRDMRVRR